MDPSSHTTVVGSCTSRHEAELQRHVLEESGIRSILGTDDAGGLHPELGFSRCATYRVLVPAEHLDRARAVLADFPQAPEPVEGVADLTPRDESGERSSDAELSFGSNLTWWIALAIAIIILAGVLSNTLDVFTGS